MNPVCAHCGHVVARWKGTWIHDGTGWRMCGLPPVTYAEPYEEAR